MLTDRDEQTVSLSMKGQTTGARTPTHVSQSYRLFRFPVLDYWSLFIRSDRCGLFCHGFLYSCKRYEGYVCVLWVTIIRNTWTPVRTPGAGLPLLPSRHVPAAVVRRVLRSRRVGAGFSRRGLPGPPPLEGSHHQAHNTTTTTTTTATAHKQTPNPPTKTILPYQNHGWFSNKPTHIKTRTFMAPSLAARAGTHF